MLWQKEQGFDGACSGENGDVEGGTKAAGVKGQRRDEGNRAAKGGCCGFTENGGRLNFSSEYLPKQTQTQTQIQTNSNNHQNTQIQLKHNQ